MPPTRIRRACADYTPENAVEWLAMTRKGLPAEARRRPFLPRIPLIVFALMLLVSLACVRQAVRDGAVVDGRVTPVGGSVDQPLRPTPGTYMPWGERKIVYATVAVTGTPTPDATRPAQVRPAQQVHSVQRGDTLSAIARVYQVSLEALKQANELGPSDTISVGQNLTIPEYYLPVGPAHKLIPDSELVYGPGQVGFDLEGAVNEWGGYLSTISETDRFGITRSGAEIVFAVAQSYSVNPRLLLVVLEQRTGWVQSPSPGEVSEAYPFGYVKAGYKGLLRQLSWAADMLNAGFYGWRDESLSILDFEDGTQLGLAPGLNAGTAAVQFYFSRLHSPEHWSAIVGPGGFDRLYSDMFGNAFGYAYEPLLPGYLEQPAFAWPWDTQEVWYFTGGPHGGWDSGSAWAAVDFAPTVKGCQIAPNWVRAAADGQVVRSSDGAVVQDFDGDAEEQTGWTLLYMHIAASGRVVAGQQLQAGDLIGHPSCEGSLGFANATHLHFARRYNGVWIAADDPGVPLDLDGWVVESAGREYDGWLVKGDDWLEAWDAPGDINSIPTSP